MTSVPNPFLPGDKVTLPKGTPVFSMNPRAPRGPSPSKRAQTITVRFADSGYIDWFGDLKKGRGLVVLPVVVWPGAGGYWHRAQVTPELAAAHGHTMSDPVLDERDLRELEKAPSLTRNDRWG